jgi:hypothetical protein
VNVDAHEDEEPLPIASSHDGAEDTAAWQRDSDHRDNDISYGSLNEERDAWNRDHEP